MLPDLKYAFRRLLQNPGFALTAILILALGIGSNTAIFTVIDSLLLRGLPVRHPEELLIVSAQGGPSSRNTPLEVYPYSAFAQFRDHAQSLSGIAASNNSSHVLIANGFGQSNIIPVQLSGVSGNFFSFLGVPAAIGRTLTPDDDRANAARPVIVLSHEFWQRQFGADPTAVGKTVLIDNTQVTIVGVAAAAFAGTEVGYHAVDLWMPIQLYPAIDPQTARQYQGSAPATVFATRIMCRLRPNARRETAGAELDVIFRGLFAGLGISYQTLQDYGFTRIELQPGGSGYIAGRAQTSSLLDILMVVVGFVLVIACANVASLLLARTAVRQRELALRTALGAGRGQLIRQLMVESLILAGAAGALGMLFAHWGTHALTGFLPGGGALNLRPDGRVVAFAILVSAGTGILVGLVPALRFSRLNLSSALKSQAATVAGGSSQRLNRTLVAAQIAFSVCLLAGAGLFVRTLENLREVDVGFNRKNLLVAYGLFEKGGGLTRRTTLSRDILAAIEGIPGVRSATFSWGGGGLLVGGGSFRGTYFTAVGYTPKEGEIKPLALTAFVGPHFFETLGIPLRQGRGIGMADSFPTANRAAPNPTKSVVISESLAHRYFGGRDPIGQLLHIPDDESARLGKAPPTVYTIVGVARDTKEVNLRDEAPLEIYLPIQTMPGSPNGVTLELRTSIDPLLAVPALRSAIQAIDPKMILPFLTTMNDAIDTSLAQDRIVAQAAGTFSLFALLLASLGLYGVLSYNVASRTREIGVRMAIGAQGRDIIGLIVRQGMALAAAGSVAGVISAAALTHLIASRLYGIPAADPLTFLGTVIVLLAVAFAACWLPARRATKVDPMIALRAE